VGSVYGDLLVITVDIERNLYGRDIAGGGYLRKKSVMDVRILLIKLTNIECYRVGHSGPFPYYILVV
jgi:hypothetical protein